MWGRQIRKSNRAGEYDQMCIWKYHKEASHVAQLMYTVVSQR
jgi:hypothetical protein